MLIGILIGMGMPFFAEGLDSHACCTIVAIIVSLFEESQIVRSHIHCHRNDKECAKTAGYTLM